MRLVYLKRMMKMKITKINHIYQLVFLPTLFPVNCYLIEEEEYLTLIDAALPSSYTKILQTAEKIGKPIQQVILTHAHSDHIGSLDKLKELLPNVTVSISKRDARLLKGDKGLLQGEENTPIRGGVPTSIQTIPDRLLVEGDQIGSLTVVETPGHTPGSISLLDTRTNAVIVGDAFQVRGGMAVSGVMKWRFPAPAFATWSKGKALESAVKIHELNPTLLAVGHGQMITSPEEQMNLAIKEAERRHNG